MDYIRTWVIHKSFTCIILKSVNTVICIPEVPILNLGQSIGFSDRLFPLSVHADITLIWITLSIIHEYPFFVSHNNSHIIHSISHNSALYINRSNVATLTVSYLSVISPLSWVLNSLIVFTGTLFGYDLQPEVSACIHILYLFNP